MQYTMKFRRFMKDECEVYESIDDACTHAWVMVEDNTAYPIELLSDDGSLVMTRDQMLDRGAYLNE